MHVDFMLRIVGRESNHGFISKEYISIGTRPPEKTKSKTMRAYTQSGQYHTIVEGCDS